jgi:hypothetical protein
VGSCYNGANTTPPLIFIFLKSGSGGYEVYDVGLEFCGVDTYDLDLISDFYAGVQRIFFRVRLSCSLWR